MWRSLFVIFFALFKLASVHAQDAVPDCSFADAFPLGRDNTRMLEELTRAIEGINSAPGSYANKVRFLKEILPDILEAQDDVELERERLLRILETADPSGEDREYLEQLKSRYNAQSAEELRLRVDTIPLELVMVQAAKETGWGSSVVWEKCNNVAGIYAYSGLRVCDTPSKKLAHFATRADSFRSYILSLNRNENYQEFRQKRAEMRADGVRPDGVSLAPHLIKYSIQREKYTSSITRLITDHQLDTIIAEAMSLAEQVE